MLRAILRNVQYYFLFFSILLVLLAFQRLQWYDQGLLHNPYAFIDRPLHGRGFTSPDNAGRVYYGGDESKEIGLFKFKLGLFNFALPTFSKDNESWGRTITVPPPPNKRRQSTENLYLRLKAQSRLRSNSNNSEERGESKRTWTSKSSVAYVVVIPPLQNLPSKFQRTSNANYDPLGKSFQKRLKVLSQSIRRAHLSSPYTHHLYALGLNRAPIRDDDWVQEALVQTDFEIINVSDEELSEVGKGMALQSDHKLKNVDKKQQSLLKLLNQHDLIVQISFNAFVLKPMDDLFDVLLKGGNTSKVTGVVTVERKTLAEGKSGEKSMPDELKSTPIDLLALEALGGSSPATSHIEQSELIIFRSSSQQATDAYLERLKCASFDLFPAIQSNHLGFRPKLTPAGVSRKTQITGSGPKQYASNEAECSVLTENSLRLDRCLYDAGNFDISHSCSNVIIKNSARVSRFSEGKATSADDTGMTRSEGDNNANSPCVKPWEHPSAEDCSKDDEKHENKDICTWLCGEWFRFAK